MLLYKGHDYDYKYNYKFQVVPKASSVSSSSTASESSAILQYVHRLRVSLSVVSSYALRVELTVKVALVLTNTAPTASHSMALWCCIPPIYKAAGLLLTFGVLSTVEESTFTYTGRAGAFVKYLRPVIDDDSVSQSTPASHMDINIGVPWQRLRGSVADVTVPLLPAGHLKPILSKVTPAISTSPSEHYPSPRHCNTTVPTARIVNLRVTTLDPVAHKLVSLIPCTLTRDTGIQHYLLTSGYSYASIRTP